MNVIRAAVISGVMSGVPSTAWALARRGDPLEATWAAGRMVLPDAEPGVPLLGAAGVAHGVLTVVWTAVLARTLPRGTRTRRALAGAAAGCAIAALDLGVAHLRRDDPRFAPVARLAVGPQVADHIAFGALAGWSL